MAKTVNFAGLTSAAKRWDPVLRTLPFIQLNDTAKRMRLNIVDVKSGEHIIKNKRRQANIIAPYSVGLSLNDTKEVMKFVEASLKPEIVFAMVEDNVTNYEEIDILSNQGNPVNNKDKKHPLEYLLLRDLVTSFSEDVAFNLFHAQRNEAVLSPATSFNGFNYKLSLLKTIGQISAGNKNLISTGEFGTGTTAVPVDDYQKLIDWLQQADMFLRRGPVILYASEFVMNSVRKSYKDRVKAFTDPAFADIVRMIRDDSNMPGLEIISEAEFGTGSQLMLVKPGLLDIGTRNMADGNFVQVRNVEADPNQVQFWLQSAYDTRIQDIHPKVFLVNEQINNINDFSGDYVEITGVALDKSTATVAIDANLTLEATITPTNARDKTIVWSTSDEEVATVSSAGKITGVAAGTAEIVATTANGKTAKCTVTVPVGG